MANGTLKVSNIQTSSGSGTITLGQSGETITVPSGCTFTNSGTATGFGGISEADLWRVTTNTDISAGMDITANWERCDTNFEKIGTGLTESSGIFTFPSTGKYLTCYDIQFKTTATTAYAGIYLYLSTDSGGSFSTIIANTNTQIYSGGSLSLGNASGCGIIDVTDASTFRFKLQVDYQNPSSGSPQIYAHTDRNRSYLYVLKIGDT